ncbi:hypothetical protein LC612_43315, partial [Nostoc sp. CHAB 5834]|nr:hypothetical protein [Nostoc sp. CHAB 5834]
MYNRSNRVTAENLPSGEEMIIERESRSARPNADLPKDQVRLSEEEQAVFFGGTEAGAAALTANVAPALTVESTVRDMTALSYGDLRSLERRERIGSEQERFFETEEDLTAELVGGLEPIFNTTVAPYHAIAHLRLTFASGIFLGTGFFITPQIILTAGHNIVAYHIPSRTRLGMITSAEVSPGRFGNNGVIDGVSVPGRFWRCSEAWAQFGDPAGDYGAIFLQEPLTTLG